MTTAHPLAWPAGWPRAQQRKRAHFNKSERQHNASGNSWNRKRDLSVADATKRVLEELDRLRVHANDAVISTNLRLRLDGLPRSDQPEPSDPGAAVYWEDSSRKMKVMAIDRYDRVADNLAAIAATLEAMRAIERHGGGQILERAFTGFTALPPPRSCWEILGFKTPPFSAKTIEDRFRELAKQHHPDVGGDHARMAEIAAARDEALKVIA